MGKMELRNIEDRFWDTLHHNGWSSIFDKDSAVDDLSKYRLTILVEYRHDCFANVATRENQLNVNGQFGVVWIDVQYENSAPYEYRELQEMMTAIELAEENLLTIGVPFAADYKFHGQDAAIKAARNKLLRLEWELDRLEQEWSERDE